MIEDSMDDEDKMYENIRDDDSIISKFMDLGLEEILYKLVIHKNEIIAKLANECANHLGLIGDY